MTLSQIITYQEVKELKKKIEISKTKENNSVSKKTEISKKKKEPEYSGFIIIRLTKETNSLKEDDLSELARKNNLKGHKMILGDMSKISIQNLETRVYAP